MFTIADVIFPAFFMPYVVVLFFPIAGIALLVAELIIFRALYRDRKFASLVFIVLASNVVSSLVGLAVAFVLPTGLRSGWRPHQGVGIHGPYWNTFATTAWLVSWFVSVMVEYAFVRSVFRRAHFPRLLRSELLANSASYIALFVTYRVAVYVAWR